MAAADRDPWWTLLLFFNSLRELGTTLTLLQSDIPVLLRGALRQRLGNNFQDARQLRKILELTGRLPGDGVPKAISALEVPTVSQQGQAVDVCLASNIIEVGVDIDRLSLMSVVGQARHLRDRRIGPRYVLLHTLAHLLINRLTYECGYSSAALREPIPTGRSGR